MIDSDSRPEMKPFMPLLFVYIHGFNSKGDSESQKIKELKTLGETITVDYDSFGTFKAIEAHLSDEVKRTFRPGTEHITVLVGTSLGGYWASIIGKKYAIPAVLINPAVQPQQSLKKHIGVELENFKDGRRNRLDENIPGTYCDAPDVGKFLILLDKGDDVFDYKKTESWFTQNPVITFEGGSHRFEHMRESLPEINRFMNRVLSSI